MGLGLTFDIQAFFRFVKRNSSHVKYCKIPDEPTHLLMKLRYLRSCFGKSNSFGHITSLQNRSWQVSRI
jgi:hypothetical protein